MSWSEEDRGYALAWEMFASIQCSGCNQPLEITTKSENQFAYEGELVRCHACAAQARTVKSFVDEGGDQAGIMYRLTNSPT